MKTKKILAVALSVIMLLSSAPLGGLVGLDLPDMFNTEASAAGGVKAKLDEFMKSYPAGSRWTSSFDGGIQCYGFGKLVIYNIFGKSGSRYRSWTYAGVSTSGMNCIGSITNFSSANVKNLLSNAKCGDILQFNTTKQHTMVVYSVESDGVKVYHCNWDNNCGIRFEKFSFGYWNGRNSTSLSLLHSDNYNEIDGTSFSHTRDTNYGTNFQATAKAKHNITNSSHTVLSGWVDPGDVCTIHEVYTDGCCYFTYPLSQGGTKTGYGKISWFTFNTTKPSNVWVSLPNGAESSYLQDTDFNISFGADNATSYYIGIYKGSDLYWSDTINNTSGQVNYSVRFAATGHYSCIVYAKNSAGETSSEWIGWDIVNAKPSNVWVALPNGPESSYLTNTNFNITFGADWADTFWITMWREYDGKKEQYYSNSFRKRADNNNFCQASFDKVGHYSCFITATNAVGEASSEWIGWDIVNGAPSNLVISTDKSYYELNEKINFKLTADGGYYKHIGIHRVSDDSLIYDADVSGTNYEIAINEIGKYRADFDSFNVCGTTRSDSVYFTVGKLGKPNINKSVDTVKTGEEIIFYYSAEYAMKYWIGIYRDGVLKEEATSTVNSYGFVPTEAGNYSIVITAINGKNEEYSVEQFKVIDHDGGGSSAFCTCNCHKDGFMDFIWKFINFFNKLFKINQYCECGAKHW